MDIVTLIITNVPYQSKNVSTRGNYRAYGNALFYLHIFSINQKYSDQSGVSVERPRVVFAH